MQSTQHRSSVLARLGVARYALHIPVSFYDHTVARDPYVHETGIPGPRRHTLTATQSDTLIRPSLVAVAQTYGRHCVTLCFSLPARATSSWYICVTPGSAEIAMSAASADGVAPSTPTAALG